MGIRSIKMPDVGEGVAEAEIVEWAVKVGDLVRGGSGRRRGHDRQATVDNSNAVAGSVLALGGGVGDVLAVGSELIRIDAPGLPVRPSSRTPKSTPQKREPEPAPTPNPRSPSGDSRGSRGACAPARAAKGRAAPS